MVDKNGQKHVPKGNSNGGQFVSKTNEEKMRDAIKKYSDTPIEDLKEKGLSIGKNMLSDCKVVDVNLNAEIQKQFDKATPKERSKIAFHYVMDNLRGKYPTKDNREVFVERVGAKEMTHTLYEPKIRVIPELGKLIKAGEFIKISMAEHGQFKEFAYYKVGIKIANDTYSAVLNIGIRDNGDSTLYDINQFKRI